MARRPNERSGPQVTQPGSRTTAEDLAKGPNAHTLTDGGDKEQDPPRKRSLPVAFASQAAPCEGTTQYGLIYGCPVCSGTHFGRSPVQVTTGSRLARCGRMVWLVVARNYSGPDQGPAA
jgi:hypothetical protein